MVSIILLAILSPFTFSKPVDALLPFFGGDGTSFHPYLITHVEQLQEIENTSLSAYYELWCDIDASGTSSWNTGAGFLPIGTAASFTGSFNGRGYTINNLFINRPTTNYIGLFSLVEGAVIQNVALTNINITGEHTVGGLIAWANNTLVSGCHIEGDITSTSTGQAGGLIGYAKGIIVISGCHTSGTVVSAAANGVSVGGIVGQNAATGTIEFSYSMCSVTGKSYIGGIVGSSGGSGVATIAQCFSTGNIISATWGAGGIIGDNMGDGGSITDCYARGDVTGNQAVGGALGSFYDGTIINIYSTGKVTGNTDVGGLHGNDGGTEEIAPCFWDNQTSNQTTSITGTGKTTAQMKTQSTFTGWDFYSIWAIDGITNDGYPYFGYGGYAPPWPGEDYVPTNLLAIPLSSSEIALSWDMGVNTTSTRVMAKTGGWPSAYNDPYATLVYEGSALSATNNNLDAGTTYYYRAWGRLGGGYSEDYAEDLATTFMGAGGGDEATAPMPPWWFQNPSCAAYNQTPVFGLMTTLFASYDLPECTGCLLVTIFILILIGILVYSLTHNALTSGLILAVAIVVMSLAGLLPMWMLLVVLVMVIGITFAWSRA